MNNAGPGINLGPLGGEVGEGMGATGVGGAGGGVGSGAGNGDGAGPGIKALVDGIVSIPVGSLYSSGLFRTYA